MITAALVIFFALMAGSGIYLATLRPAGVSDQPNPIEELALAAERGKPSELKRRARGAALTDNPMLKRAIDVTANLAERRGLLGTVERKLRAGDIPVRPAEAILAYVIGAGMAAPLPLLLWGPSSTTGVGGVLLVVLGPIIGLNRYVKSRKKKFDAQLPDMLTGLASSLRAGRSTGQSLELLSIEQPDPVGREMRKIVAELRLGWPMVDTLDDAAERIGSEDFEWAVMAMKIQAEVGGNLAELLDQVAETMRERTRFKGEVKALTAEGRASAMMLVIMPPALVGVMKAMNPTYIEPLFSTSTGRIILYISGGMLLAGWFAMNKIVKVDA